MDKDKELSRVLLQITANVDGVGWWLDPTLKASELMVLNTALDLLYQKVNRALLQRIGVDDEEE